MNTGIFGLCFDESQYSYASSAHPVTKLRRAPQPPGLWLISRKAVLDGNFSYTCGIEIFLHFLAVAWAVPEA